MITFDLYCICSGVKLQTVEEMEDQSHESTDMTVAKVEDHSHLPKDKIVLEEEKFHQVKASI